MKVKNQSKFKQKVGKKVRKPFSINLLFYWTKWYPEAGQMSKTLNANSYEALVKYTVDNWGLFYLLVLEQPQG